MAMCLVCFYSCEKANDEVFCWKFVAKTKCTGLSATTTTYEKCDLTEYQAEEFRKNLEVKITTGGKTCTVTATKAKK